MGDAKGYEEMLFKYQSQVTELERKIKGLEEEVKELKRENKKLKGKIVEKGKKAKTEKSGLGKYGASFQ